MRNTKNDQERIFSKNDVNHPIKDFGHPWYYPLQYASLHQLQVQLDPSRLDLSPVCVKWINVFNWKSELWMPQALSFFQAIDVQSISKQTALHLKCVGFRPCWSRLDKPHGANVRFPTLNLGSTLQAVRSKIEPEMRPTASDPTGQQHWNTVH